MTVGSLAAGDGALVPSGAVLSLRTNGDESVTLLALTITPVN